MSQDLRMIALEEHYATPELLEATGLDVSWIPSRPDLRLTDLGEGRLKNMDASGIDLQVLSAVTPATQELDPQRSLELARRLNDDLAGTVAEQPDRFAAFATLPTGDPAAAVAELEHAIQSLGFVGAMIHGATRGAFLDNDRFRGLLEAAAGLDVPIYLHPEYPVSAVREAYFSGLPENVSKSLATAGMGWHNETALHAIRLIVSGIFDRIPNLKIILGHLGEGLPFYLERLDEFVSPLATDLEKPLSTYLRSNFWYTTSGFFYDGPFALAREAFGDDRLMFSVDYPFSDNGAGAHWFKALGLPEEVQANIAYRTATDLLKL